MAISFHPGSWLGLPDLGITEGIQKILAPNAPLTQQGGSNLFGPQNAQIETGDGGATRTWDSAPINNYSNPVNNQPSVPSSTPQQQPSQSVPTEDPRIGEANNYFNKANELLNQQVNLLGSSQATANQGVENFATQQGSAYQQALDRSKGLATTQKGETSLAQRGSEAEALRNYKLLEQNALSRYGTGSNTGGALTSILGETFLRTLGSLREKTSATFSKIFDYEKQSEQDYNNAMTKLQSDKEMAIRQNADKYQAGMLEIASMRNLNEQAKTNLKIQVLTDNINRAREIADYSKQLQDQYDVWMAQQKVSAQQGWQFANDLYNSAINQNLFNRQDMQATGENAFSSMGLKPVNTAINPTAYKQPRQREEDEFNSTNPWLV